MNDADRLREPKPSSSSADATVLSDIARLHQTPPATPVATPAPGVSVHEASTILPGSAAAAATVLPGTEHTAVTQLPPNPEGAGRLGPYELISKLGEGGMGEVYRARHVETGQIVALKRILSGGENSGDLRQVPQFRNLFRREAERLKRLEHPNIIRVLDIGETPAAAGGELYYAMEFMAGGSLAKYKGQRLPARQVAEIGAKIADALVTVANDHGCVHRDIKPENILLRENGDPVLADFGIVHSMSDSSMLGNNSMGTPLYMAPEIARGEKGSYTADIYSLGAVLYYLVSGRKPYDGDSYEQLKLKISAGPPQKLAVIAPDVPADLVRIIEDAMAHPLRERYASTQDFLDDLQRFLRGEPVRGARDVVQQPPVVPAPTPLPRAFEHQGRQGAPIPPLPQPAPRSGVGVAIALTAVIAVVGLGGGAAWWMLAGPDQSNVVDPTPNTPTTDGKNGKQGGVTPPAPSGPTTPKRTATPADWALLNSLIRSRAPIEKIEELVDSVSGMIYVANDTIENPAIVAAEVGNLPALTYVLEYRLVAANEETKGDTPLSVAATRAQGEIIEFLLAPNTEIAELPLKVDSPMGNGDTALLRACRTGQPEVITLLLKHGAQRSTRNAAGESPLEAAVAAPQSAAACVQALLSGLDEKSAKELVNERGGKSKKTPLERAVSKEGNADVVRMLLEHGADPNVTDAAGRKAIDIADDAGLKATYGPLLQGT